MRLLKKLNLLLFFMDGAGAGVLDAPAGGGGGDAAGAGGGEGGAGGEGGGGAGAGDGAERTDGGAGGGDGRGEGGEGGETVGGEGARGSGDGKRDGESPEAKIQREESERAAREADEQLYERDGRKVDDKTKKMIAGLKKNNPDAAKALADQFFHRQAFEKEFPSVQAARAARALLDSIGGVEGAGKLQTEVSNYRNEISQFAKGDKDLIYALWDTDKEGCVMAASNMFDVLMEKDPTAFQRALLPHFKSTLDQSGMMGMTKQAMQLLTQSKGQEAYDLLAKILDWDNYVTGNLAKSKQSKATLDPERKKLADDRAKFEKDQQTERETKINTSVNEANNRNLARQVDPFLNEMKIPFEGRKRFVKAVYESVWDAMREDKEFIGVHERMKQGGDNQRRVDFITEKFKELLPDHFQSVRNSFYPNYKARPAPPPPKKDNKGGGGNAGGGAGTGAGSGAGSGDWRMVDQAPKPQDVDQGKTTDMMIINGQYILKNGQKLKVR